MIQLTVLKIQSVFEGYVLMIGCCRKKKVYFFNNYLWRFVISKRLSGHYKFEFTSRKERQFYE
jgi:hypothetical protein